MASAEIGLASAREELRLRQGPGARFDSPNAPARELDWARRGTAYFLRKLADLRDEELDDPSGFPLWTKRRVAVHIGYQARAFARVVEAARTRSEISICESEEQKLEIIKWGLTLPSSALRHLVVHAAIHLNVEWRDLDDIAWDLPLSGDLGTPITARDTALARSREIWKNAIYIGGLSRDLPYDLAAQSVRITTCD